MRAPARQLPASITLALLIGAMTIHPAAAMDLHLRYAEPVATVSIERATKDQRPGGVQPLAVRMRFHALQRNFDAMLEDNARLVDGLSVAHRARLGSLELYRGTLAGIPGSWVRMSVRDGVARALIWDGLELYALAPASSVSLLLTEPLSAGPYAAFRMADLQRKLHDRVWPGPATPPVPTYDELQRELVAISAGPDKRIDVGVVTDVEATRFFGGVPVDQNVAERMNYVDGIYSEQVGVQIQLADIESFSSEPDPFPSLDPERLLQDLSDHRVQTPALAQLGIVHLLTGRDPDGLPIGEAYLSGLCDPALSVGWTQASVDPFTDALVMAHEIGHNLGAPHDAEVGSACALTPPDFLMAPQLNGSPQFSQCSLDQMTPVIAAATCLESVLPADLAVSLESLPVTFDTGAMSTIGLRVSNSTDAGAYGVRLDFSADPLIELEGYSMPSPLECTNSDEQHISCQADAFPANTSVLVDVSILATTPGVVTFTLEASAGNDANPANDRVTQQVQIAAVPMFNVTFEPARLALHPDESGTLHVTVHNEGTGTSDAIVYFLPGFGMENVVPGVGTCMVAFGALCTVPSLAPGAHASFAVTLRAPPSVDPNSGLETQLSVKVTSSQFPNIDVEQEVPLASYTALAELSMRLASGPSSVHAGDVVPVVIAVDNAGPDAIDELTVSVIDPIGGSNLDMHSDTGSCTFDARFGACSGLHVAAGGTVEVELDVQVSSTAAGTIVQRLFQLEYLGVSDSNRIDDGYAWSASVTTTPTDRPSQGSSSGGGGASITLLLIAGLAIGTRRTVA